MLKLINDVNWSSLKEEFLTNEPFNHIVIDNFFTEETLKGLLSEFPDYESEIWDFHYLNAVENKKACNHWDKFPKTTYSVMSYLCGPEFVKIIEDVTGQRNTIADIGLHGGGWHGHKQSGNLNVHLDYSIHPKLGLERKFNLIVYLTPNWLPEWGGELQLWSHDDKTNKPKECVRSVENKFNRAILFDTTQNSWHGLPGNLNCPENEMRRSLAIYYVTEPKENASPRGKALFVPHGDQVNDPSVLELIRKRSNVQTASQVYKQEK
jgi:Rps23 Pro-64 3,4-dihydroxylase Tpa1-like proline 4-hydroxylase